MKSLKAFIVLALSVFLLGCVTPPDFDRHFNEPAEFKVGKHIATDFYNHKSPWDSPFNPHEVLRYWDKIHAEYMSPISLLIVVGNPKINWEGNKQNPDGRPIPEGEFTSAVAFIFMTVGNSKEPELVGYGYTNRNGRKQLFRWEKKKKKYTWFRDYKEKRAQIY